LHDALPISRMTHFPPSPVASRQPPVASRQSPVASRQSPAPIAHRPSPIAHRPSPIAGIPSHLLPRSPHDAFDAAARVEVFLGDALHRISGHGANLIVVLNELGERPEEKC